MPYRKRYGGHRRHRTAYRRSVPFSRPIFPAQKLVLFRETNSYNFSFNGTNGYGLCFPANLCRNRTGYPSGVTGNTTPLGFNLWAQFYNKACVVGSKFTARIMDYKYQDALNVFPCLFFLHKSTNAWDFDNTSPDIRDMPFCIWKDMPVDAFAIEAFKLEMGFSNKKWFGWTDVNDVTDQQFPTSPSISNAGPAQLAFFNVGVRTLDNLGVTTEQLFIVEIMKEYSVLFSDSQDIYT